MMKQVNTHKMNMICNIQSMQKSMKEEAGEFEEFAGKSEEELEALQEQTLERYNQFHKSSKVN